MRIKQFDLGWVVGIYDGEGSMSSRKNGKTDKHYPYLEVAMTDEATVLRFAALLPGGNVSRYTRTHKYRKTQYQEMIRYRVTKAALVTEYAELMYPFLSDRRQGQISEVFSR